MEQLNLADEKHTKDTRVSSNISGGRWRIIALVLLVVSICLLVALIVVIVKSPSESETGSTKAQVVGPVTDNTPPVCTVCKSTDTKYGNVNLDDSNSQSVFKQLSEDEVQAVVNFLFSKPELNLANITSRDIDTNYIYCSDLHLPNKQEVLQYLDKQGPKPVREAQVIVFRGAEQSPYVEEILVGPLPNPTYYKPVPYRPKSIPFIYRPFDLYEFQKLKSFLTQTVSTVLDTMFEDIFGGKLTNCTLKCLEFDTTMPVSSVLLGEQKRKSWFPLMQRMEYAKLFYLDFSVFLNMDINNFSVEKIWFYGQMFDSLTNVLNYYNSQKDSITKSPFPEYSRELFSTLNQRGEPPMDPPLRNPRQVSPDGKRYNINGGHIEYMFWQFDVRMSLLYGPQLYDIRFKNERIAYELGLQEIAVFYAGHKPIDALSNFLDSYGIFGDQSRVLFPGIDCPSDASFLRSTFHREDSAYTMLSSFCVFELNTGTPLRRHVSYWIEEGRFYEGMENVVLVLRTVLTIDNYDYMIDFMFYQNGALEVKVTATGYVKATSYSEAEKKYSFRIHDNLAAPIHHHLINFKADLDIKGTSNRFATLNIETEDIKNEFSKDPNARLIQYKFVTSLKTNETEAAYHYEYDFPKYLIIYNEGMKDKYGNSKGYRIVNRGMSKLLLPKGSGNEPSISWARYELAVTKHNDSERTSSSLYSALDVENKVVDFQQFIDDNDNIVDEDLVAWITIGNHHIPHTEDLPVTTTPGMDASFLLLPYNYFEEDAAIASKNAVRVEPVSRGEKQSAVNILRYGVEKGLQCVPEENNVDQLLKLYPQAIMEN